MAIAEFEQQILEKETIRTENGLPEGISLTQEDDGIWFVKERNGYVRGLGFTPDKAISAVYDEEESKIIYQHWAEFQNKQGGGE